MAATNCDNWEKPFSTFARNFSISDGAVASEVKLMADMLFWKLNGSFQPRQYEC